MHVTTHPQLIPSTSLPAGLYRFEVAGPGGRPEAYCFTVAEGIVQTVTFEGRAPANMLFFAVALRAARIVERARLTGEALHGLSFTPTAAPIGKPAAERLHRAMSRCGLRHTEHYTFAADTLSAPVPSLAALFPLEARLVWAALCARFPQAGVLAA